MVLSQCTPILDFALTHHDLILMTLASYYRDIHGAPLVLIWN